MSTRHQVVFDCEIIGTDKPVFLVCVKNITTGVTASFWHHVPGDMNRLSNLLDNPNITWISFNGLGFDAPMISGAIHGGDVHWLKSLSGDIIDNVMKPWQTYTEFAIPEMNFDHIDLMEVAPGVMVSLKRYAGRMGYRTMVDMPFHHDTDLDPSQYAELEQYCLNDLGVTEALYNRLRDQIDLRSRMSKEYGTDLRSKSDAQMAETILKRALKIGKSARVPPKTVGYQAPAFIKTDSPELNDLITRLNHQRFTINEGNGSPELPHWMAEGLIEIGEGTYQLGIGGLHSTHDKSLYLEASDKRGLSDFDVASYYPSLMIYCGMIPELDGNKGSKFLDVYKGVYHKRLAAKAEGDKVTADSLKITLNGTFGKLGSVYSAFYSPDLMLAVTITGQLNLLILIYELEKLPGVKVRSANTDGILVDYCLESRPAVLKVFEDNSRATRFEYEETPYEKYAAKDVNNYIAVTTKGKVKRKGLYASISLMKNPTMQVCSDMAVEYLTTGKMNIHAHTNMVDFVAVRDVKGGGVQHTATELIDHWDEVEERVWQCRTTGKRVKRKSRPAPIQIGVGGVPFGRVARWYMTLKKTQPITYVVSGNQVPKTEGAMLCMTLPETLPLDLDEEWYLNETRSMLTDMGVIVQLA